MSLTLVFFLDRKTDALGIARKHTCSLVLLTHGVAAALASSAGARGTRAARAKAASEVTRAAAAGVMTSGREVLLRMMALGSSV